MHDYAALPSTLYAKAPETMAVKQWARGMGSPVVQFGRSNTGSWTDVEREVSLLKRCISLYHLFELMVALCTSLTFKFHDSQDIVYFLSSSTPVDLTMTGYSIFLLEWWPMCLGLLSYRFDH